MKVLIAVPTYETVSVETFKSIYGLQIPNGMHVLFNCVRGYGAARARNLIAQEVLDEGFDAVLMVDSDIELPSGALKYLSEGETPIVLGAYPRRNGSGSELFEMGQKDFVKRFESIPPERFDVKGGGLGCAFIRRVCFEQMPFPWFNYVEYPNKDVLSEDNYFCNIAAQVGLRIEADGRVRCGHVSKYIAR